MSNAEQLLTPHPVQRLLAEIFDGIIALLLITIIPLMLWQSVNEASINFGPWLSSIPSEEAEAVAVSLLVLPFVITSISPFILLAIMGICVLSAGLSAVMYGIPLVLFSKTASMAIFKLKVVNSYGEKPAFLAIIIRLTLQVLSLVLIFPLIINMFLLFGNKHKQCLHDILSDTWVVKTGDT